MTLPPDAGTERAAVQSFRGFFGGSGERDGKQEGHRFA